VTFPHHDGSELYVSNRAPQLGEKVTLKVRTPKKDKVEKVFVRILQDGEPVTYPLKKSKSTKVEQWWQVKVEVVSPSTNYRFLLRDGRNFRWLNAAGVALMLPIGSEKQFSTKFSPIDSQNLA